MTTLADIRARLAAHDPEEHAPGPQTRQAAVAIILKESPARGTEILFIRRAEKEGDPWSGHMAFPGGHLDPEDAHLLAAAERETLEEIGLDLTSRGEFVGPVDHQRAMPRGRVLDMLIAPFVFFLDDEPRFRPNHEVAEVVWTPLNPIITAANHTHEDRIVSGTPTSFSGYRINGGHFVWGLTYRVLHSFFVMLDERWEAPPEA